MPRALPWWQFNPITFLLMTAHMSDSMVTATVKLMCHAWGKGESAPYLPADPDELLRLAGIQDLVIPHVASTYDQLRRALGDHLQREPDGGRHFFPLQMDQWRVNGDAYERRAQAGQAGGKAKAASKSKKAKTEPAADDPTSIAWNTIRNIYPRRLGDQNWRAAEARFRGLVDGKVVIAGVKVEVTADQLVTSVKRYALHAERTNRLGTEYVKQAATFFGRDQAWKEFLALNDHDVTPNANGSGNGRQTPGQRQFGSLIEQVAE